jgi:predicted Zn-dependent protease
MDMKKTKLVGFLIAAIFLISVVSSISPSTSAEKTDLEKLTFIHYRDGSIKIIEKENPAKQATCYKLMGVKWSSLPVNYVINPTNPQNLPESFITSAISTSAETWDNATSRELFNDSYTINYYAQYGVQNFENAIVFGSYPNNGVIAVTSIWYNRKTKQIVEFDMLFNTYYTWGDATQNSTVMDLQNIATHEFGHSVGLNDVYITQCSSVTMYGYSDYGETQKRTLEQPDITGLQKIYGA